MIVKYGDRMNAFHLVNRPSFKMLQMLWLGLVSLRSTWRAGRERDVASLADTYTGDPRQLCHTEAECQAQCYDSRLRISNFSHTAAISRSCLCERHKPLSGPLFPEGTDFASPPASEVLRRNVDADILQSLGAQVTVKRPLYTGVRIIALGIWLNDINVQAHDVPEKFAYLVLCVLVFARELQDLGHANSLALAGSKVLDSNIYAIVSL